jgi:hypothetical protein
MINERIICMSNDVHENRLRRMARRQGFYITKSRLRDYRARDYGKYLLSTIETNTGLLDGWTTLDRIERFLLGQDGIAA